MSTLGRRADILAELKSQDGQYDVIIVGGGITGAGILREATRQGLRALLLEQRDFAWGTSSRSSKMVHGGLRYIAQGDIRLTRHSALERERLIREAPGLVERMGYLFPIRKGQFPGKLLFSILLAFYDTLAGIRTHGWHDADALGRKAPGIRRDGLKGASYYTDAVTDDARLVLRVLQEACAERGRVLNYAQAKDLLRDGNGQVAGVVAQDTLTGETLSLPARVVINATGAWVDELREKITHDRAIRPLRGSHIVIPARRIPVREALTVFHPADKRATFIFPWEGCTVVGTTDLDHAPALSLEPGITRAEVDYLLQLANDQFPDVHVTDADIVSTWAGVRPVISKDRSKDPSKEKRDHKVWIDRGLVSVSGGKLTTFRLIARDTLDAAKAFLPGVSFDSADERVFSPTRTAPDQLDGIDRGLAALLLGRYGDEAGALLRQAQARECEFIAGTRWCLAELRWSCRNEQVVHLDDLLLRRSRLGLLLRDGGAELFPALESLCRQELGWSDAQWQAQLQRYQDLWRTAYALPQG